jgi:hypothetical protein
MASKDGGSLQAAGKRGCGARRGRAGIEGQGVGDRGIRDCLIEPGRIDKTNTYQATYPIFTKKIGYSSNTYRWQKEKKPDTPPIRIGQDSIRIGYMIRGARLPGKYPCNVALNSAQHT